MLKICDMWQSALLPFRRKACWGYFRTKNTMALVGANPRSWVPEASMLTTRPPEPLEDVVLDISKCTASPWPCLLVLKITICSWTSVAFQSQLASTVYEEGELFHCLCLHPNWRRVLWPSVLLYFSRVHLVVTALNLVINSRSLEV
jgi:hypothetical protein